MPSVTFHKNLHCGMIKSVRKKNKKVKIKKNMNTMRVRWGFDSRIRIKKMNTWFPVVLLNTSTSLQRFQPTLVWQRGESWDYIVICPAGHLKAALLANHWRQSKKTKETLHLHSFSLPRPKLSTVFSLHLYNKSVKLIAVNVKAFWFSVR